MYSKLKIFSVTAAALAVGILLHGCGTEAPNTPLAQDGLKTVSLGSSQMFTGDITRIPGYEHYTDDQPDSAAAKAQALIDFDEAYAIVVYCLFSNGIIDQVDQCASMTDLFNAFHNLAPLDDYENFIAGARSLQLQEIVSVSQLTKSGDYVEGTIYVKPGWNDVGVVFVKDGVIIWQSMRTYLNLDGMEGDYSSEPGFTSGWTGLAWDTREFYLWETALGDLSMVTQGAVDMACGVPYVMLTSPEDGMTDQSTYLYLNWLSGNFSGTITHTLYVDTVNPPRAVYIADDPGNYYAVSGLLNNTTYYWQVVATDGVTTKTSQVRSFTTIP